MIAGGRLPPVEHTGERLLGLFGLAGLEQLHGCVDGALRLGGILLLLFGFFLGLGVSAVSVLGSASCRRFLCRLLGRWFGWCLGGRLRLDVRNASTATAVAANAARASLCQSPVIAVLPPVDVCRREHLPTHKLRHFTRLKQMRRPGDWRLFHSNRLGEVARLVDVGAHEHRRVVGDELHRDRIEQRVDEGVHLGHRDMRFQSTTGPPRRRIRQQDDLAARAPPPPACWTRSSRTARPPAPRRSPARSRR